MKHIPAVLLKKARKIKLLLLDVDGVLTDGGIYIDRRGAETKRFDVRDGQGITLLRRGGVEVGFITGRSGEVIRFRARELGVTLVYDRVRDKIGVYEKIKRKSELADEAIAYAGDDMMDLPILRRAGMAIAIRDGWAGLRQYADYVTLADGGKGAVREICELLLSAQGAWKELINPYLRS